MRTLLFCPAKRMAPLTPLSTANVSLFGCYPFIVVIEPQWLGLHFGPRMTSKISIVFEDLSKKLSNRSEAPTMTHSILTSQLWCTSGQRALGRHVRCAANRLSVLVNFPAYGTMELLCRMGGVLTMSHEGCSESNDLRTYKCDEDLMPITFENCTVGACTPDKKVCASLCWLLPSRLLSFVLFNSTSNSSPAPQDNGVNCTDASVCASGFCIAGVCCASDCLVRG